MIRDPYSSLEPTGKLSPQAWMNTPEAKAVMAALMAGGEEARFVGGCVRDSILKRPVRDIDIATPEPPERVIALLDAAGIKAIPTGIAHGTVTAVIGEAHYEITTLRRDVETHGRHATVAFSRDWTEDAARRDFTINALSCNLDGDVYDPFGGLEDLGYGRIRFVGRAAERIDEDVLRLLRYFRFYAELGQPPADSDALAACRSRAHKLPTLSGERVRGELFRLLSAPDPAGMVTLMRSQHVIEHILPEAATDVGRLRIMQWLDSNAIRFDSVVIDPLRRLAALLDTDADGAAVVADRLRLSNHQRHRLIVMASPPLSVTADLSGNALRAALFRHGPEDLRDMALLAWADKLAEQSRLPAAETEAWKALIAGIEGWDPVHFPLRGRDAESLGIEPGLRMGALLRAVEDWWVDGGCNADHTECLIELKARVGEAT
ncbi:MAG: CCA tRNA nucleotidyltransferase [Rhodospirillales bacterium]|nr:CCA tRNA nucleotidyltransferase [Rhodospirillales bacterium]MCW9002069.1 CCA tRNA nucleotidyltransferase [Rhodospirillales bacterium]